MKVVRDDCLVVVGTETLEVSVLRFNCPQDDNLINVYVNSIFYMFT